MTLEELRIKAVKEALERNGGRVDKAAKDLGISTVTVSRVRNKYKSKQEKNDK